MNTLTNKELLSFAKTLYRMTPVQLAQVSGAALGLAVYRKPRHTLIRVDDDPIASLRAAQTSRKKRLAEMEKK